MALIKRILLPFLTLFISMQVCASLQAQGFAIAGTVTDTSGTAIPYVTVLCQDDRSGALTDTKGYFELIYKGDQNTVTLIFSCIGYITDTLEVTVGDTGRELIITLLNEEFRLDDIKVTAYKSDQVMAIQIPVASSALLPSITAGIEALVQTLPGVTSLSELSYQYSVRGGSYDENLVYINDIEVIKPYLIRSGQQEGLSQINPDLVASVSFSPGGFSALYGDRMSSVLDIRYRKPEANEASISLSMLTSSAHAGFVSKNKEFYILSGIRYRSNSILLKSLDTDGEYRPAFTDLQAVAGYTINSRSQLTLTLRGSSNKYLFTPKSQTTTFGSVSSAYKLFAAFEGGERDLYDYLSGSMAYEFKHTNDVSTMIILSGHHATENENFDIRGAYNLRSLDRSEETEYMPDSLLNIGIGSWLDHARNRLISGNISLTYRGSDKSGNNVTDWGVTGRHRKYEALINEWLRVDSAGYTIASDNDQLVLTSYSDSKEIFTSLGTEVFINNKTSFGLAGRMWDVNAGMRVVTDSYNNEILLTPRASVMIQLTRAITAHLAFGAYHQLPGGRELMRQLENASYPLKSQRSYHITAGTICDFTAWDRPFRFTAELYGKKMNHLIPYTIDNVRLIYYGGNIAEGYSAGIDLRVNGEFVEGAESWFSLSLMKAEMRIPSSKTGWFPAPFDQRLNVDIFFQDYLPGHPDFRAHINIVYGTGVPTSPPGSSPWETRFRMPSYRRVDIGFSKVLIGEVNNRKIGKPGSVIKNLTVGIEIFNLADINNTISYTWIRSVNNSEGVSIQYAVPNYLTSRSLNLKVAARF